MRKKKILEKDLYKKEGEGEEEMKKIIEGETQNQETIERTAKLGENDRTILDITAVDQQVIEECLDCVKELNLQVDGLHKKMEEINTINSTGGEVSQNQILELKKHIIKIAELGQNQILATSEKFNEITTKITKLEGNIQSMEEKITLLKVKEEITPTPKIQEGTQNTNGLSELSAKAAEERITIEVAKIIQKTHHDIKEVSEATIRESRKLQVKMEAKINEFNELKEIIIKTRKEYLEKIDKTPDESLQIKKKIEKLETEMKDIKKALGYEFRKRNDEFKTTQEQLTNSNFLTNQQIEASHKFSEEVVGYLKKSFDYTRKLLQIITDITRNRWLSHDYDIMFYHKELESLEKDIPKTSTEIALLTEKERLEIEMLSKEKQYKALSNNNNNK